MSKDLFHQLHLQCMCFWMNINKSSFTIFCWVNTYITAGNCISNRVPIHHCIRAVSWLFGKPFNIFSNTYFGTRERVLRKKGLRQVITFQRKKRLSTAEETEVQRKGQSWYKIVWNEKWNQELKIELHFLLGNTQTTLSALHKFYYCCSKW